MVQSCKPTVYIQVCIHCFSHCLEYLEEVGECKVRRYLLSIKTVDFITTLVTIEHVLRSRLPLTTFLQVKQCTLSVPSVYPQCILSVTDPDVWNGNAVFDRATELVGKTGASKPRNVGRQRQRPRERTRCHN